MPITTNTAAIEAMNTLNACSARSSGTVIGTEMICAPIDLVQAPAEAVGRAVALDHRLRRGVDGAVAVQAGRRC